MICGAFASVARRAGLPSQSPPLTPLRGAAQRRGLDPIRLNSATRTLYTLRYTAFLCCDLAALSPAAAARLYISSVLPLKIGNRRRQNEY